MTRAIAALVALAMWCLAAPASPQSAAAHGAVERSPTSGPTPARAADPADGLLLSVCGEGDARLHAVARVVALRASRGLGAPSAVELGEVLRDQGEPHAKARAWTFSARRVDRNHASERLRAWVSTLRTQGTRRCGIASYVDAQRGESVAVVAVDVLADLRRDIPARVRLGAWVTLDAVTATRATAAKVVVLGPRGLPRTIPTSFDPSTGQIVGRFRADAVGAWLVQVLAAIDVGPMPVLEARVMVGDEAPRTDESLRAPGETLPATTDDASVLFAMIDAARASERLPALERDPDLDRVADDHVQEMLRVGVIGHDVGDGLPPSRLQEAGIRTREAGENVAKAPSAALAHRALWWSPSHRGNLLFERYTRVGIAARRDGNGLLWVTEVFAD